MASVCRVYPDEPRCVDAFTIALDMQSVQEHPKASREVRGFNTSPLVASSENLGHESRAEVAGPPIDVGASDEGSVGERLGRALELF